MDEKELYVVVFRDNETAELRCYYVSGASVEDALDEFVKKQPDHVDMVVEVARPVPCWKSAWQCHVERVS